MKLFLILIPMVARPVICGSNAISNVMGVSTFRECALRTRAFKARQFCILPRRVFISFNITLIAFSLQSHDHFLLFRGQNFEIRQRMWSLLQKSFCYWHNKQKPPKPSNIKFKYVTTDQSGVVLKIAAQYDHALKLDFKKYIIGTGHVWGMGSLESSSLATHHFDILEFSFVRILSFPIQNTTSPTGKWATGLVEWCTIMPRAPWKSKEKDTTSYTAKCIITMAQQYRWLTILSSTTI